MGEDGEAHTLRLLRELRELAGEIAEGHEEYAHRFHELLQSVHNPNLPDVAKDFGFTVQSVGVGVRGRTVAICANATIAVAAWECACKIFPKDRWILTWGGMVQYDSAKR